MRRTSQDLYDGIGTWKRRPIRAGKKTYMSSHKRWGKITVTKMPTPEGVITTTEILKPSPEATEFAEAILKLDDEKLVKVIEVKEEG